MASFRHHWTLGRGIYATKSFSLAVGNLYPFYPFFIHIVFFVTLEILFPKILCFFENVAGGRDRTGIQHERSSAGVPYTWVHPKHVAAPLIVLSYT